MVPDLQPRIPHTASTSRFTASEGRIHSANDDSGCDCIVTGVANVVHMIPDMVSNIRMEGKAEDVMEPQGVVSRKGRFS